MRTIDLSSEMEWRGKYFFSPREVIGFKNTRQGRTHTKPWGLWYACGDAWLQWVMAEVPYWSDNWQYLYRVITTDAILELPTSDEVLAFNARYRFDESPYDKMIDWAAVAHDFPGIEICPQQLGLSTELEWYRGWSVASGCIWDEHGIDYILPIAKRAEPGIDLWEEL